MFAPLYCLEDQETHRSLFISVHICSTSLYKMNVFRIIQWKIVNSFRVLILMTLLRARVFFSQLTIRNKKRFRMFQFMKDLTIEILTASLTYANVIVCVFTLPLMLFTLIVLFHGKRTFENAFFTFYKVSLPLIISA